MTGYRENKKISIFFSDAGFGHRSCANSIAQALYIAHGENANIELINPFASKTSSFLLRQTQTRYDGMVCKVPFLYKEGYTLTNNSLWSSLFEKLFYIGLLRTIENALSSKAPDVVVTTYPPFASVIESACRNLGLQIPIINIITDYSSVHRFCFSTKTTLTIVPSDETRQLAVDSGISPDAIQVLGIPVNQKIITYANKSKEEIRSELGLVKNKKTILAIGSKRVRNFIPYIKAINDSDLDVQMIVITGGDMDLNDEAKSLKWKKQVLLCYYLPNSEIMQMMRAADVLVSKAGGVVLSEALASQIPIIIIDVLPGQEEGNAEYVQNGGAGEIAQSPDDAVSLLGMWFDHNSRLLGVRADRARQLGFPNAAIDIADRIWTCATCERIRGKGLLAECPICLMDMSLSPVSSSNGTKSSCLYPEE